MKISGTFWKILCLGLFGLGVAGFASQTEAAPPAGKADFLLRCAGTMPLDHFMTKTIEFYDQVIQEKSKSRVKLEIYPVNQLFSDKDLPKALPSGAVDMGQVNLAMWVGLIPSLAVLEMPFFFKDRDHYYRALDSPKVRGLLEKDFEAKGVKLLFWMDYGFMALIGKKPIRTLEDFKGKRIRGMGEVSTEIIKALGGAPAFLSVGEVYMALQRSTIDGVYTSTCSVFERKFFEVTKYYTRMNFGELNVAPAMLMNLKKFKELPPEIQKTLMESAAAAQTWGLDQSMKGTDECIGGIKEKGMEVAQLSEKERKRWADATKSIMTGYLARTGKEGQALVDEVNKVR